MIKVWESKRRVGSFLRARSGDSDNDEKGNSFTPKKSLHQIDDKRKKSILASTFKNKNQRMQEKRLSRKRAAENEIREILLKKHEKAKLIKSKISKIKSANRKKIAYIAKLNAEIVLLQSDSMNHKAETRRRSFGDSCNDHPNDSTDENSEKNSKMDVRERNKIMHQLICKHKEKDNLVNKLDMILSARNSAITDLENIVFFQDESISSLLRYVANPKKSNFEEKYLSLSLGKDMDAIKSFMTNFIDELNDIDVNTDESTWIYAKSHARNKIMKSSSIKIIKEVKIFYKSEIKNEDKSSSIITTKLQKYIELITKLECYMLHQINSFSLELDSFYAIMINVDFFMHAATQFHTLIKEATAKLELIQTTRPNNSTIHQQEQQQNNIYYSVPKKLIKSATAKIKVIHSIHNLVTTSLQSMRAWLTLLVESFSKDDTFFKSFKSTFEDMKRFILIVENEEESISYKSSISSTPTNSNFILPQDASRIILNCKIEEMDVEMNHLMAQCEESNRIIHKLSESFHFHEDNENYTTNLH